MDNLTAGIAIILLLVLYILVFFKAMKNSWLRGKVSNKGLRIHLSLWTVIVLHLLVFLVVIKLDDWLVFSGISDLLLFKPVVVLAVFLPYAVMCNIAVLLFILLRKWIIRKN